MKFVDIFNSSANDAVAKGQALLCASGYETRARACLDLIPDFRGQKVVLGFDEFPNELSRPVNDERFREMGFESRVLARTDSGAIDNLMSELVPSDDENRASLIIDISSMTRVWYAAIIRYMLRVERPGPVTIFVLYTPAIFTPPPAVTPQSEISIPIPGFAGLAFPDRPVALVLGLGYEPERALGLRQLLDPALTVAMVPRSTEHQYVAQVLASNDEVVKDAQPDWLFDYFLADPGGTFRVLESLASGLLNDFRVVTASLGPKLFSLECLLVGSRHPDLSVWWVSAGGGAVVRDVAPDLSRVVVSRIEWT